MGRMNKMVGGVVKAWNGIVKAWNSKTGVFVRWLAVVTGGVIAVAAVNECSDKRAANRDKAPILTKSEERMIANKGRSVDPYTKDGAIQGIFRTAENFKWTPSQADDAVSGTQVQIETADGARKGMVAHPKVSRQDVSERTYNADTLLEPAGATDMRIPSSPTNGNTLLEPVGRINENKGLSSAGAPAPAPSRTVSHNGNRVVYQGKSAPKTTGASNTTGARKTTGMKATIKAAEIGADGKPAVYNSRRDKGYTQAGQKSASR